MINRRTHRGVVWVDLESPEKDEVRLVMDEFGIHPLVADELLGPSLKPKVDYHGNSIYCILHFPLFEGKEKGPTDQEVDFVIGKNFLITTRYSTVDPLLAFSKVFDMNSALDRGNMGDHAGYLFYYMVKNLYRSLQNQLARIETMLRRIEDATFSGRERDMVVEISKAARDVLAMKRSLALHGDTIVSLRYAAIQLFGDDFDSYLRDAEGEFTKVNHSLHGLAEFLSELRSTNDSLLTAKQNQIGQTLTVMAFIILPASLIASIFSMQVGTLPLSQNPSAFWIIIGIMSVVALSAFLIFKRNRWL